MTDRIRRQNKMGQDLIKKHSTARSVILHLFPGFLAGCFFLLARQSVVNMGYPSSIALILAYAFILIPVELGYLLYQGKKKTGRFTLWGIISYRNSTPWYQYLVWVFVIFIAVGGIFTSLKPIDVFLQGKLFFWMPDINYGLDGYYSRTTLIVTYSPVFIFVAFLTPRNEFPSPSSICDILHKINCLHKPPKLVDLSTKERREKMKRIFTFTIILMVLTACTAPQVQTPEPAATDIPQMNMPNPASLYCEQNGNTLELRTAADGSQSGVCIFPDGSTCDEWAYFRGECGPAAQTNPTPAATVTATTEASGDGAGEDASGGYMAPGTSEAIADWWGVIKSTDAGAQYDDYFERQDLGQIIYFGIDSMDPAVQAQIEALRDSGKIAHLYGTLFSNVPDYNGSQIVVERIEVEE